MAVRIKNIAFDCADPYRLAKFWPQLTGFVEDPGNGNAPEDQRLCCYRRTVRWRRSLPYRRRNKTRIVCTSILCRSRADATRR